MRKDFAIGTKFLKRRSKRESDICTVIDILVTFNLKDELVSKSYVATYKFLGQTMTIRDVCWTTIKMNLIQGEI